MHIEERLLELESQLNTLKGKLAAQEVEVRTLSDIEEIQKVQRAFGYYVEHILFNEVADLWCDGPEARMEWMGLGVFEGKDTIRKAWQTVREWPPENMHTAVQLSPFISVEPDGKTAHGRWYAIGGFPSKMGEKTDDIRIEGGPGPGGPGGPGGPPLPPGAEVINSFYGLGLYENDYIKQDGKWKLKVMRYGMFFMSQFTDKIETPEMNAMMETMAQKHMDVYPFSERWSRSPRQEYPSTWIRPFHFKHPVTGEKTSEDSWNSAHPVPLPPGGERWLK